MLVRSSHISAFVAFRIAAVVVLMRLYASYFAALVADFITVIFIPVRHIIFTFFAAVLANFGANMPI